jgi:hypothetical protein
MKILKSLLVAIALISYSSRAHATLNITIKDDNLSKTKILFVGFESNNFSINNEAKQILQKIIYNLETTNLTEPVIQNQISQTPIPLQNNEIIVRYKDRLNELKRIQELIYRVHEAPLNERKIIKDASEIHHSRPYVQFLGTRVTQGGRGRKTKNKTNKVARVH